MGESARIRTEALLAEAELGCRCAMPGSESEQRHLARLVESGELVRPRRSLYARRGYWQGLSRTEKYLHQVRALGERHPQWIFCGPTAAVLHGLDVPYALLDEIHVICDGESRSRKRNGVHFHQIKYPDVVSVGQLRATSLPRTLVDCLRVLGFTYGLAIADSGVRKLGWNARQLVGYVEAVRKMGLLRGLDHAIRTASYADGRAENGGESIARASVIRLGRMTPDRQVWVDDPVAVGKAYRVDFLWLAGDEPLAVGELDGIDKYLPDVEHPTRSMQREIYKEKMRESHIGAYGIKLMRFSFDDALHPSQLDALLQAYGIPRVGPRQEEPAINPNMSERMHLKAGRLVQRREDGRLALKYVEPDEPMPKEMPWKPPRRLGD